jgi:hypothetical protein
MNESIVTLWEPLVFLAVIGGIWIWAFSRSREMLNDWAQGNGCQIISSEHRWFRRGPFFWTSSKGQIVYYVTVRMPDGQTRQAWVRCGSFWWGIFQDKVEARWES